MLMIGLLSGSIIPNFLICLKLNNISWDWGLQNIGLACGVSLYIYTHVGVAPTY